MLDGGWRESFGLPAPAAAAAGSEGGGEGREDDGGECDGDDVEELEPSSSASARRPRNLLALDALSLVVPAAGSDGTVSTMLRSVMRLAGGGAR